MAACGVRDPRVVRWGGGCRTTPDPDPVYLYTDDVIGILPERNLSNGQPPLHAALIDAAAPQPGEHVVHGWCHGAARYPSPPDFGARVNAPAEHTSR